MAAPLLLFLGDLGGSELLLILLLILGIPALLLLVGLWRWVRPRKPTVPATQVSVADELSKLWQLREQGVLTAQEFEQQKQRVLR